jgi:Holliday junction resolvasome RuvABC endonuclease subunit
MQPNNYTQGSQSLFRPRYWTVLGSDSDLKVLPLFKRLASGTTKNMNQFLVRQLVIYELKKARSLLSDLFLDRCYVWGLDLSLTGTGFSAINVENKEIFIDKFSTSKEMPLMKRGAMIGSWLGYRYDSMRPAMIVLEGAFIPFGQKFRMAHSIDLVKLNYLIEFMLYSMGGSLYRNITPRSIKKYVTGTSKASKMDIRKRLCTERGIDLQDEDMSDAFSMALIALDFYRVLKSFELDAYDITDKKSMLQFSKDMGIFLGAKHRSEVMLGLMSVGGLAQILPEIEVVKKIRCHPKAIYYDGNQGTFLSDLQKDNLSRDALSISNIKL